MVMIPNKGIDSIINNGDGEEFYPRHYLGLSANGEECLRSMQYAWRWAYKRRLLNRISRLFRVGHYGEDDIINELEALGCKITGRQIFIESLGGHWLGHIDGIIELPGECTKNLLEIKTHNQKNFNALLKHGVKKAFPKHYDQMQAYMSHKEIPKRGVYVAINKNDSTVAIIKVDYDEERARQLERIRLDIITTDKLLPRIDKATEDYFKCRFCDAKNVCFGATIQRNCRTCKHVDIMNGGKWHCSLSHSDLDNQQQEDGCKRYALDDQYFS
jgi:hypothetical protein